MGRTYSPAELSFTDTETLETLRADRLADELAANLSALIAQSSAYRADYRRETVHPFNNAQEV